MKRTFKPTCIALGFSILSCISMTATAANAWYSGAVTRVALLYSDGSFIVALNSSDLDDCEYKDAYFKVSQLGADKVKEAFTLATTSLLTGRVMGIVIDKTIHGSGGECDATGQAADLR